MLRLPLFLLLSLALHAAGWLLHGKAQPPALSAAQTREAPQVLRLAAVLQQAAPAPVKLPEQPQPQRQAVVPRKARGQGKANASGTANSKPARASAANRDNQSVASGGCSYSGRAYQVGCCATDC